MITSMRRCVACDDLWPWSISLRSFGLDLENCVRSVASTVLDGFLLYLAQIITIIRGCGACYVVMTFDLDLYLQVIRPWLWKSCLLCNVFSSRSIFFLTWDPIWLNSVGNHEATGGYPQNAGVLVVLVNARTDISRWNHGILFAQYEVQ